MRSHILAAAAHNTVAASAVGHNIRLVEGRIASVPAGNILLEKCPALVDSRACSFRCKEDSLRVVPYVLALGDTASWQSWL